MNWKKLPFGTVFLVFLFGFISGLEAQTPLTISVDTNNIGPSISPDFSGLSFEISRIFPGSDGVHYFRPDNRALVNLFQTLGIKSLRIGGNTSDRDQGPNPSRADLDSFFAFARAADVKVIYCLRLRTGTADQAAKTVKYIMQHYADQLDCFSIGQEPNVYPRETNSLGVISPRTGYADFKPKWQAFEKVIVAEVPDVKFCGPSVDDSPTWPQQFIADFGQSNHVVLITTHLYPGRSAYAVPSPEIGRDRMLSDGFLDAYQKLYDGFVPLAQAEGLPYRLEEANNFYNGGATNVSDTFAASLWGLDFLYWWAAHGAIGVNFHTGDKVSSNIGLRPCQYTAYVTSQNGFQVRPLGYGIEAFHVGAQGSMLSASISNSQNLNVDVYSVLGDDQNVFVTIINKEHGSAGREADTTLTAGTGFNTARIMSLTAPNSDIASKTGITLGNSAIDNDGDWKGSWTDLTNVDADHFNLIVPPSSAAIIHLIRN
jgi:hypothetical protein